MLNAFLISRVISGLILILKVIFRYKSLVFTLLTFHLHIFITLISVVHSFGVVFWTSVASKCFKGAWRHCLIPVGLK